MDWNNVDLTDSYERDQTILDPYSFDALLLEISCNLKEINEKTVTAQFNETLNDRIMEAKEIFAANLKNIVNQARKERS